MSQNDRESVIEIWNSFRNEIFVYTNSREFWQHLSRISGFEHFSTYYMFGLSFAWQASFPSKCRGRVERLWGDYAEKSSLERQRLVRGHIEEDGLRATEIGKPGKSYG